MNKLLVSDSIDLSSGSYNLDFSNKEVIINISGEVNIYIANKILTKLIINLKDESILNLYKFNKGVNSDLLVEINQFNNSKIFYNETCINESDINLKIDNYINGNNNESNINIRCVANRNLSKIIINANINKSTINNVATEDIRGINNGGFISIEPNIVCETNEVVANHLTTIGCLDKDLVSYLMSKGISELRVKKLLLNGFIKSNMDKKLLDLLGGEIDV